ncbi:hypothetical protein ABID56_000362 [Alkalibacillus flavidus]|uniref:Uncharacterized protein n=1 Tax=Alkalibacillus flavidus TaxID=546021 RepID=A0ABV2KRS1_9BACI
MLPIERYLTKRKSIWDYIGRQSSYKPTSPYYPKQTMTIHDTIHMIQKGLALIEQLLPLWKQYRPLLKHAPFMVDMIKLMLEEDKVEYNEQTDDKNHLNKSSRTPIKNQKQRDESFDGLPHPKLYI